MSDRTCSNCGSRNFRGDTCVQCGHGPMIGPGLDITTVIPEPKLPEGPPNCPRCEESFDGWECKFCGFSFPQKARKAHPQIVGFDDLPPRVKEALRDKDRGE